MGYLSDKIHQHEQSEQESAERQSVDEGIELDPRVPFEAVLIKMVKTHRAKREDYAGLDGSPWQNFYDSAYQINGTAGHSVEQLIGVKQARLRVLLRNLWNRAKGGPRNEPIRDTLLDRAVYSVIALCIYDEGGYQLEINPPAPKNVDDLVVNGPIRPHTMLPDPGIVDTTPFFKRRRDVHGDF